MSGFYSGYVDSSSTEEDEPFIDNYESTDYSSSTSVEELDSSEDDGCSYKIIFLNETSDLVDVCGNKLYPEYKFHSIGRNNDSGKFYAVATKINKNRSSKLRRFLNTINIFNYLI